MQDNHDTQPPVDDEASAEDAVNVEDAVDEETALEQTDADPEAAPAEEMPADEAPTDEAPAEGAAGESPAADLPTMEDLDGVAEEVQRVEATLPLLDKKNSPMCDTCQSAFAEAAPSERMELLTCSCT